MKKTAVKKTTAKKKIAAKKVAAKKAVAKKAATKKVAAAKRAVKSKSVRIAKKATPATCANPTTLFEVEFPTTILFWAGVALFFLFVLLMFTSVFN